MLKSLCLAICLLFLSTPALSQKMWGSLGAVEQWNPVPPSIVINEVFAYNIASGITDDFSDLVGFIELYSQGGVDLEGWSLSTDSAWYTGTTVFPAALIIASDSYLRIWTSGLGDVSDVGDIHAPFQILGGVRVLLRDPSGKLVSEMSTIGVHEDISFGRCQEACAGRTHDFFDTPTPLAINVAANRLPVVSKPYLALPANTVTSLGVITMDGSSPTYSLETSDWLDPDPPTDGTVSVPWDWHNDPAQTKVPPTVEVVRASHGGGTADTAVTVVGWTANLSTLNIISAPKRWLTNDIGGVLSTSSVADKSWRLLGGTIVGDDDCIFFGRFGANKLFCTKDGFQSGTEVGTGPGTGVTVQGADYTFKTPFGYIMLERDSTAEPFRVIPWKSPDLTTWTRQKVLGSAANEITRSSLLQGFDYHFDVGLDTLFVYTVEYSAVADTSDFEHSIYRAVYTNDTMVGDFLETVTFPDRNSLETDGVRHVHALRVDPYTGDVWVGTGDADYESKILISYDNGATFTIFAEGSQDFRTLGFWFTPNGVWWNTDSTAEQSLTRVARSNRVAGVWPPLSELFEDSGQLTPGVSYTIHTTGSGSAVPSMGACAPTCAAPLVVVDTTDEGTILVSGDKLFSVKDPARDYRVRTRLDHASQWYFMPMDDPLGEGGAFTLMTMSASEGTANVTVRDDTSRIFGIRESADGTDIDIQEVLGWVNSGGANLDQFNTATVGSNGLVYLIGRGMEHGFYVAELLWTPAN